MEGIITHRELKSGMLVRRVLDPDTMPERCWVVLEVTREDIDQGTNTDVPGLYGFGGMWYGERTNDDPTNTDSYGKITWFDEEDVIEVVNYDVGNLPTEYIKLITG